MIFNEGQKEIIRLGVNSIRNSSDQIFEFTGDAGTGKSVVLHEILTQSGLRPDEILPMAYTGQAAIVMRTKGFNNAKSIHSSLYEYVETPMYKDGNPVMDTYYNTVKMRREFRPKDSLPSNIKALVFDEGYMVPDYLLSTILKFGRKVIVAGDKHQLGPVKAKPAFLTSDNVPRLTELMRQSGDSAIPYIARRAMNGQPIHNGLYGNTVLVIDEDELTDDMLRNSSIILCGKNKTREEFNGYIRGSILGIRSTLPVYGDRMICRKNNWGVEIDGISLANGLVGTVTSMPNVTMFDGKEYHINFQPDLLDQSFKTLGCDYNYLIATPEEKQLIKNDRYSTGNKFEYAYCSTTHLSQGSEYMNGIYMEEYMGGGSQKNINYTGITRFRQSMIYVKPKVKKYYFI